MEHDLTPLIPLIILLLAGIAAVALSRAVRLTPLVGFIAAGMVLGPSGSGMINPESNTTVLLAELGVTFLLFDIGLHFSRRHIWEVRHHLFGLGPVQMTIVGLIAFVAAWIMGLPPGVAVLLGFTLALSSTAVVAQTLSAANKNNCPIGQSALAVLIFQDIAAIFLLVIATSLGDTEHSPLASLGMAFLSAAGALIVALLLGRFVMKPLFEGIAKVGEEELFTAVSLLIVFVTGYATASVHLSMTLGAFLAGMIISETPYRQVIQSEIKPFRALLLGFFFIVVGAELDLAALTTLWPVALAIGAGLIVVKLVGTFAASRLIGGWRSTAITQATLLAQGSELAFVVMGAPFIADALGPETATALIAGIVLTLAITPVLYAGGRRAARWITDKGAAVEDSTDGKLLDGVHKEPVLIFGMGKAGQRLAAALEDLHIPHFAVERNHERFLEIAADGFAVTFGDMADPKFRQVVNIKAHKLIVFTKPHLAVGRNMAPLLATQAPGQRFLAPASDEDERLALSGVGVEAVEVDHPDHPGLDLTLEVLRAMAVPDEEIQAWHGRQTAPSELEIMAA